MENQGEFSVAFFLTLLSTPISQEALKTAACTPIVKFDPWFQE